MNAVQVLYVQYQQDSGI